VSKSKFAEELKRFGPHADSQPVPLLEAQAYCRKFAKSNYENFTVASWLLPAELHQPFHNLYAYCRWADNLADEIADPSESLDLLRWWERELEDCYRGRARHPVFVALTETIEEFDLPPEPFTDLLSAFRQDQRKREYETFGELKDYCRRSADPVGRLVMRLGRFYAEEHLNWSDAICTGLQLANFWQDVRRDYEAGRVYLPRDTRRRCGVTDTMFESQIATPEFKAAIQSEVQRARELLESGRPLVTAAPANLQVDIELFIEGGLLVLSAIEKQDFDVWKSRPVVSKLAKAKLLWNAWRAK